MSGDGTSPESPASQRAGYTKWGPFLFARKERGGKRVEFLCGPPPPPFRGSVREILHIPETFKGSTGETEQEVAETLVDFF